MQLTLERVTFAYPHTNRKVLDDASFTLADGEHVALMAPSGAGKSTALAIAGLLLRPETGSVLINGKQLSVRDAHSALGKSIAWIPQFPNLLTRRSVVDNVAVVALAQGSDRRRARLHAASLLEDVGLVDDLSRNASTLSGGEAQRVAIARALMSRPPIILIDEPTASLDQKTAREVGVALMKATIGTSLIVATHDHQVASLADRVVRLVDGKFVETGGEA